MDLPIRLKCCNGIGIMAGDRFKKIVIVGVFHECCWGLNRKKTYALAYLHRQINEIRGASARDRVNTIECRGRRLRLKRIIAERNDYS